MKEIGIQLARSVNVRFVQTPTFFGIRIAKPIPRIHLKNCPEYGILGNKFDLCGHKEKLLRGSAFCAPHYLLWYAFEATLEAIRFSGLEKMKKMKNELVKKKEKN